MLVEKIYYDVKGSVKNKIKKIKDKKMKIKINVDTERPPTLTFPAFTSTEDVLTVHTSVSLLFFFLHVHKQKYIHSSHFGTVFFLPFFFVHKKITKAPKSTIESACGDACCGLAR